MPDVHARLSPSSSERWIRCPPSIKLGEEYGPPDEGSVYAEEGTEAHSLCEFLLRKARGEEAVDPRPGFKYYDQEMQVLDSRKTIFEEISDDYPAMTNTEIRTKLAAFLFTGDDVLKRIGDLSGGERARVSLCKLMLSDANFLILDEPTNHLDIQSREVLESTVRAYEGTVLCVSHDRYFINRTATRILDLTERTLLNYIGNYDYYLEKKEDVERAGLGRAAGEADVKAESAARTDWKAQKEEEARRRRIRNELKRTEDLIGELEERDACIDSQFELPEVSSSPEKLMALGQEKEEIAEKLAKAYEKWEALSSEAETF